MPVLVTYLLKLSVSLSVVFLFYFFILRKLTFYNHNRWYLLGYTLLSFFIPLINISPVLEKNNWSHSQIVNWVPVIERGNGAAVKSIPVSVFSTWDLLLTVIALGMGIMLIRLLVQLYSLQKLVKKAVPLSAGGTQIYQVNERIIPFSFVNSIFINQQLHSEEELKEIIRHEFVHVKQKHSLDIIWAELLCLLNWFNPFAWLLKKAIRQNLEFIADNKVLEKGANKKEYQYLLLRVTGNSQYSLATQFNFSSLKKRITMMNKLRSAKASLLRFLFLLPLLAVVLVSFRKHLTFSAPGIPENTVRMGAIVYDEATHKPIPGVLVREEISGLQTYTDENGYFSFDFPTEGRKVEKHLWMMKSGYQRHLSSFSVAFNKESGEMGLIGFDALRGGSTATVCSDCPSALSVKEEDNPENIDYSSVSRIFADYLKGKVTGISPASGMNWEASMNGNSIRLRTDTVPGANEGGIGAFKRRNPDVKSVSWRKHDEDDALYIRITLKNGKTEEYNLNNEEELKKAESKYGPLPTAPPPPPPPPSPPGEIALAEAPAAPIEELREIPINVAPAQPPAAITIKPLPANVEKVSYTNNKVVVVLKNGKKESYDLNKANEKKAFDAKYGDMIFTAPAPPPPPVREEAKSASSPAASAGTGTFSGAFIVQRSESSGRPAASTAAGRPDAVRTGSAARTIDGTATGGVPKQAGSSAGSGLSTTIEEPVALTEKEIILNSPSFEYTGEKKRLVMLDGKELQSGNIKLKGDYKLKTLSEKEAVNKYGDKGKNGALEITSIR